MGNCGSNPNTKEGDDVPVPEPVAEEVKVEETAEASSDDKSLGALLNKNGEKGAEEAEKEEPKKTEEEVAAKAEAEVVAKAEEEAKPASAEAAQD